MQFVGTEFYCYCLQLHRNAACDIDVEWMQRAKSHQPVAVRKFQFNLGRLKSLKYVQVMFKSCSCAENFFNAIQANENMIPSNLRL